MYNSSAINIYDENVDQHLSQEYSDKTYHEMQPVSGVPISQPTADISCQGPSSSHVRDPRFDNYRSTTNQPLSSIPHSIASNNNRYVAPVTSTELPTKKRRTAAGTLAAPSTEPLPRKRFNPAVQSTAAAMMNNVVGGENTLNSRTVAVATKSISETTHNRLNQVMKPLMKLCEDTNGLMKEMLKQMAEQTHLIEELVNVPRELRKSTEQLSHVVHMQARVLQTRQQNDDEHLTFTLNGINLGHISRCSSLNMTARSFVRAAYGETASFNNLAPGDFDLLLGFVARIHQLNLTSVVADSQSIKNSLQQMKHDGNKKKSSIKSSVSSSKQGTSTTVQPSLLLNNNEENDDYNDDDDDEL